MSSEAIVHELAMSRSSMGLPRASPSLPGFIITCGYNQPPRPHVIWQYSSCYSGEDRCINEGG